MSSILSRDTQSIELGVCQLIIAQLHEKMSQRDLAVADTLRRPPSLPSCRGLSQVASVCRKHRSPLETRSQD